MRVDIACSRSQHLDASRLQFRSTPEEAADRGWPFRCQPPATVGRARKASDVQCYCSLYLLSMFRPVVALIERRTFGHSSLASADLAIRARTRTDKPLVTTSAEFTKFVAMSEIPQGSAIYFGVQVSAFSTCCREQSRT